MPRWYHLIAAVLASLTAVALLGAAVAVRPPGPPPEADGPNEAANRAVALAFYDAANAAIETGDLAPLAAVVAPDLLAGEPPEPGRPGQAGLRRHLLAIHATAPALRLTVAELAVDGDLVIARVDAQPPAAISFLGLHLVDPPPLWGPVDVLRLADGRVVGLMSGATGTALLEPALAAPRDLPDVPGHLLEIRRVTIAAGATHIAAAVDGFRLVYADAGTVTLGVVATSVYAARPAALAAGEHLAIPAGVAYAARNTDDAPAVLLDLAASRAPNHTPGAHPAAQAGPGEPVVGAGIDASVLAHARSSELPTGQFVLAAGRVTLAPGARLAWAAAAGPVLLHVEAGAVTLDPTAGIAWAQDGSGRSVTLGDDPVPAGNGALVGAGNAAELRAADAPTTLLIVTLLPASGPIPAAVPPPPPDL